MKKFFGLLTTLLLLNGCAESLALLGPASTAAGGGNVVRSTISTAVNYGVKKQTGKSPSEHALNYIKENNPKQNKEKCLTFLESTNSEICSALKNKITDVRVKIKQKSKIEDLD